MTFEQKDELAALHAAGALDGPDLDAFLELLRSGDTEAQRALAAYQGAAAQMAAGLSTSAAPSHRLKQRILQEVQARAAAGNAQLSQFNFISNQDSTGWQQARLPGASIKVLSCNREANYALVLGKLAAGVRYPAHDHVGPEDLFILSGDLEVGGRRLRAGDFHHSDSGTHHEANYTEEGCTLLAVVHPSVLDELGVVG